MSEAYKEVLNERLNLVHSQDTVKPVFTPLSLGREIIKQLPHLDGSVLVLSDCGLLVACVIECISQTKNITFVAHTVRQAEFARELGVSKIIQVGYNEPIKELEKQLMGLKFNIIVGNPPYGKLHLPILKIAVEHLIDTGVCITIQPIRWLQDPLWHLKNSDAKKMRPVLLGKLDSIEIIPSLEATKIFTPASITMDLGIFVIKAAGGSMSYDGVRHIQNGIDMRQFAHMIEEHSTYQISAYDETMQHFVPVGRIGGSGSGRGADSVSTVHRQYGYFVNGKSVDCKYGDGLTLTEAHKANRHKTNGKTIGTDVVVLDSAAAAKNFYKYVKLDAFRFFIMTLTADVHIPWKFLPFPKEQNAFDSEWTDEKFFNYFKIDEEQRTLILKCMKDIDMPF